MEDISKDTITRAAGGNIEAFEEIYKMYSGFVYNVAFRVACNQEDAREVTQDVFLTVYRKLKSFRFQSSFKTWIYRIAVNMSINYVKKISKKRNRTVEYNDNFDLGQAANLTDKKIQKEHRQNVINKLLSALNPEQRACIVLRHIEGLSYEEIAGTLKVNINTVRTRLKRAREKLLAARKEVVVNGL